MSLLLNEDFTTYELRLAYLQRIHDGVGERLITLNTAVLSNPAFRAAGWIPDAAAIRRCYSPPIPTTGAGIASEYFKLPPKALGTSLEEDGEGGPRIGRGTEEGTGGIGLGISAKQRRRRKEQMEEDDSSDLSDDSDEDEPRTVTGTAASSVKFPKTQGKDGRSKSIPGGTLAEPDGPAVMITSPSRPPEGVIQNLRRPSLGAVDGMKKRARGDTITSSELSSENELDPNQFNRWKPGRPVKKSVVLADKIAEEDQQEADAINDDDEGGDSFLDDDDDDELGEASDLSDEFEVEEGTGHSPQLLGLAVGGESADTSPLKPPSNILPAVTPHGTTTATSSEPKRLSNENLPKLPKLPPGRPMSTAIPPSLLTMALKGNTGSDEKPFQRFAELSGKGEASPLWIKIYAPFSEKPTTPIEVPLRRIKDGNPVTVVELIGLALWSYNDEGYKPALSSEDSTVNRWTLRMVEDEEVDFDFPALNRTRPVGDFTSNNNRPPQRRARDKPWDEFGLVKATAGQFKENEALTPQVEKCAMPIIPSTQTVPTQEAERPRVAAVRTDSEVTVIHARPPLSNAAHNPITGRPLVSNTERKESNARLDLPQRDDPQSTPRTGAVKTVTIHFTDPQSFAVSTLEIPTTTDTYIAEVHDQSCKKLNLDKALYVLKVHRTQTVAPSDRTVEALGERLHLDLVRRRFAAGGAAGDGMFGLGLSGSPGSSSPNAPLELTTIATPPTKKKKGFTARTLTGGGGSSAIPPNATMTDPTNFAALAPVSSIHNLSAAAAFATAADAGKRYNVLRKHPLSFAAAHPRTLILTPEYIQILPAAPDSLAAPTGKVTNVPMNMIIGAKVSRKHPKLVRVLVYREREPKRYDFECASPDEAARICADVRRGTQGLREGGVA